MLGLGYPGGVAIDKRAATGDATAVALPRALPGRDDLDFSFSGLKTAVATLLARRALPEGQEMNDFCASFQAAVVDVLVRKSRRALAAARIEGAGRLRRRRGEPRPAHRARRRGCGGRLRSAHPAPQVLHRQRRDDRRRGHAAFPARRAGRTRSFGRPRPAALTVMADGPGRSAAGARAARAGGEEVLGAELSA